MKQEFLLFHDMNEICKHCGKTRGEHNSYALSLFNINYCEEESLKTHKGQRFEKLVGSQLIEIFSEDKIK